MYIEFNRLPIRGTQSVNDFINVDMTSDGKIAGIELLALSMFADDIEAIYEQYDIRRILAGAKPDPELSLQGLRITYDRDADAMYIRFNRHKFARTKIPTVPIIVDLASDGRPIGIEILQVAKFIGHTNELTQKYDIRRGFAD